MISISVVMPVYNTPVDILREAVDSILCQTFRDFEFIIIDDGSEDATRLYLQNLKDDRIRLIRNHQNLGITRSLNTGLREAKGKYIARMDGDDIALPERLEKQYRFMETHPKVFMCGTNVEFFGAYSRVTKSRIKDMDHYRISALFTYPGPAHPTAFFNRKLLQRYGIKYDENLIYAQDYGIYVEISRYGKICILREPLLRLRVHDHRITNEHRKKQIECDKITRKKLVQELIPNVTDAEMELHYRYGTGYDGEAKINAEILNWLQRLMEANDRIGIYDKRKFKEYVYNTVEKRAIYHSFDSNMPYTTRVSGFFEYLPFPNALRATMGMSARGVISQIRTKNKRSKGH